MCYFSIGTVLLSNHPTEAALLRRNVFEDNASQLFDILNNGLATQLKPARQ